MSAAVIPVLIYEDIEAAHDQLVKVFGFASDGIERTPDGTVVHAEVRLGDSRIWLHRVSGDLASPASHGAWPRLRWLASSPCVSAGPLAGC